MPERHIYFWSALALFSIVNLTSTLDLIPNKRDHWDRDHKWVVSVPSISLCLSGFGVICNILMKDKFMGSKGEAGMALVLLAFWSAGMSAIVDPDAEPALAVNADREVNDANLFFSSWAALTLSLVLIVKSAQHVLGIHNTSTIGWVGLATANFITMAAAAQVWNDTDCGDVDGGSKETYCNRTGFAIILGLVSGVAAVGMFLLRHKMVLQLASMISLVAWCFGVAYITYEQGPGNKVGVLFFSTWTTLAVSLYLAVNSVKDFIADHGAQSGEEGVTVAKDDDTDEQPLHDEESPDVLKDAPPTDVKSSTEEGSHEVLKFKNSLDEEEEYEIEEIDDDGDAVEIEEEKDVDEAADEDEAPMKEKWKVASAKHLLEM